MLANGDVKAARACCWLRAGRSPADARAGAWRSQKTYDPIALRQLSTTDPGPDLGTGAPNWYQKAREWGRGPRGPASTRRARELSAAEVKASRRAVNALDAIRAAPFSPIIRLVALVLARGDLRHDRGVDHP